MIMNGNLKYVLGSIVAIILGVLGTCTIVFVTGDAGDQRLSVFVGIVTAIVGPTLLALLAILKVTNTGIDPNADHTEES